jgi:hypothetical protein
MFCPTEQCRRPWMVGRIAEADDQNLLGAAAEKQGSQLYSPITPYNRSTISLR